MPPETLFDIAGPVTLVGWLALVAFARARNDVDGQILSFFVITVAAAEVAVGLALLVGIFRTRRTTNVDDINILKG